MQQKMKTYSVVVDEGDVKGSHNATDQHTKTKMQHCGMMGRVIFQGTKHRNRATSYNCPSDLDDVALYPWMLHFQRNVVCGTNYVL